MFGRRTLCGTDVDRNRAAVVVEQRGAAHFAAPREIANFFCSGRLCAPRAPNGLIDVGTRRARRQQFARRAAIAARLQRRGV